MEQSLPGGIYFWTGLLQPLVVLAILGWAWCRPLPELTRRRARLVVVSWILFITAEFWILGPYSYVRIEDEGEVYLPLYIHLADWFVGGRFVHGVSGGSDLLSGIVAGNSLLSLEWGLFTLLPSWVAVAINKLAVAIVAVWGAYLLARRGGGADRGSALAIAMAFSLSHPALMTVSVGYGVGFALGPLAIYLLVCRLGRKHYAVGAVALAALHAVSTIPLHASPALGIAVGLAWLFTGMRHPRRFMAAFFLLVGLAVVNWSEVMAAITAVGPESDLVDREIGDGSWYSYWSFFHSRSPESLILGIAALTILAARRSPRFWPACGMVVASAGTQALGIVPWEALGLGFLKAYKFHYLAHSLPPLLVLAGGWAASAHGPPSAGRSRLVRLAAPMTLFLAIGLSQAAYYKFFAAAQWLGFGGQSMIRHYPNLATRDWAPDRLFRVVTVPYRIYPLTTAAYGLESFDGVTHYRPRSVADFWRVGLPRSNTTSAYAYITKHETMDFLCCRSYDFDRLIDVDRLRLANVEFVVSALPLTGKALTLVSGPADGAVPPRRDDPLLPKMLALAKLAFTPTDAYVYRIAGVLPRAFVARRASALPAGALTGADYDDLNRDALDGAAAVAADAVAGLPLGNARVDAIREVADGYDIEVSADSPATVVVNTPWSAFWRAGLNGSALTPIPANAIHLALAVPAGRGTIELRYAPPGLRRLVADRFGVD